MKLQGLNAVNTDISVLTSYRYNEQRLVKMSLCQPKLLMKSVLDTMPGRGVNGNDCGIKRIK